MQKSLVLRERACFCTADDIAGKESSSLAAAPTATGKQPIALRRDALITPCVEKYRLFFRRFLSTGTRSLLYLFWLRPKLSGNFLERIVLQVGDDALKSAVCRCSHPFNCSQ